MSYLATTNPPMGVTFGAERFQNAEQRGTAGPDIPPRLPEVAGIPRVGDISRMVGIIQQQADLALRIAAENAAHIAEICAVHADEQVVFVVVSPCNLPRGMPVAGNAVGGQFPPRGRVDGVSQLLTAGGGG